MLQLHFSTHEPVTRGDDGTQPQMCFTTELGRAKDVSPGRKRCDEISVKLDGKTLGKLRTTCI